MLRKMNHDAQRVRIMTSITHAIAEAATRYAGTNNDIVLENEVLLAVGMKK